MSIHPILSDVRMFASIDRLICCATAVALTAGSVSVEATLPGGIGWHELPNTHLRQLCPGETQYPGISGNSGCNSVTSAWSGAAFDTVGNRLLIMGGGHSDYAGNEVYELDLDTVVLRRINEPSYPLRDGCVAGNNGTFADGRPVARHTYNHLEYLPENNLLFLYGGSRWSCGGFGDDTWTFDPATNQWATRSNANAPRAEFSLAIARDPVSGLVYARDTYYVYSYDVLHDAWTQRSDNSDLAVDAYKSAVIDPKRRRYFFYVAGNTGGGGRTLHSYDISSTTAQLTLQTVATPTCAFMDDDAAGWAYDPTLDRLVAWNGGDTLHVLNADAGTCTQMTFSGGPAAAQNGTYGRFRYSPASHAYVACNGIDANCSILRLDAIFRDGFEG